MSKKEEITQYVGKFIEGLTKLMRAAAHETVDATFGDGDEGGGSEVVATTRKLKAPRRVSAPKQLGEGSGGDAKKLILSAIRATPGVGRAAICATTGLPGWKVTPLLNELASAGAVRKSGAGRGTTYSTR